MKTLHNLFFKLSATLAVSLLALASSVRAQTIIQDNFTAGTQGNGVTMSGLSPDTTNTPGGQWFQVDGYSWGPAAEQQGGGYPWYPAYNYPGYGANMSENGTGVGISIGSAPSSVSISAGLSPLLNTAETPPSDNTLSLGFYNSSVPQNLYGAGGSGFADFTGLQLDNLGDLSLVENGAVVGSPVAYSGGTFSNTALTILTYDVNTTTGAISDISLEGSTADYSSLEVATGVTDWSYAGVYAAGSANQNGAFVSDFLVAGVGAVPEPGTYGMLAAGALSLCAFQYRRRQ